MHVGAASLDVRHLVDGRLAGFEVGPVFLDAARLRELGAQVVGTGRRLGLGATAQQGTEPEHARDERGEALHWAITARCYTAAASRHARRAVPEAAQGGGADSVHEKEEFGPVNDYEIMLLLDPEIAEERGDEIIQRIRDSVEGAKGSWDGHEPWGRRRLAFEIGHKGEAVYHLLLFTAPTETLDEITRVLRITDGVMRYGAYRRVKGGHLKPPSQVPVAAASSGPSDRSDDRDGDSE